MNESTPRLWFLPPLDTLGSFRVGFGVALGLFALNLTAALGRTAALIALYVAGSFVIFTLVTILGRPGGASAELPSVVSLTFFIIAALYLPLSGARSAIGAAKQAELDRIAEQLGHHDEVLGAFDGPDRADRLMAYRERVRGGPEWPFGVGTAPRALLYVALPLLSWIAAALVERAVAAVLR